MKLCAIADEACQGIGSPLDGDESEVDEEFLYHAAGLLHRDLPGSSVCEELHYSRLRVLPKMHTPQNGLTIRSLSLYVCLCAPSEVVPAWIEAMSPLVEDSLNLLVVPWPMEIVPAQFRVAQPLPAEMSNMPNHFGFFTFAHRKPKVPVVDAVKALYEAACDEVGRVDGVVLPELALSESEHDALRDYVLEQGSFLVSGVGAVSRAPSSRGTEPGLPRLTVYATVFTTKAPPLEARFLPDHPICSWRPARSGARLVGTHRLRGPTIRVRVHPF